MLIVNGHVVTFDEKGTVIADGAVKVAGERIVEIGPSRELRAKYPGDEKLDAGGALVMPGMICAHTHFYGAFARGIPARGGEPPADFPHILEGLWWRLDQALRPEDVEASVQACLADAIRHGATTLIDHHSSPRFIQDSLDIIGEVVLSAGVRAALCYEVSDRHGPDAALAGIRENMRFLRRCRAQKNPWLAGMMGLHASLTLSEGTLRHAIGVADDLDAGVHLHVAEDESDVSDSLKKYGIRVVERLVRAGALNGRTLAAHCVHVDDYELDELKAANATVVHNPRSNMNNAVGTARVPRMLRDKIRVALGNDGFSNNMFTEMHVAFLVHKMAARDPRVMPAEHVMKMAFENNRRAMLPLFPAEVGILAPGSMADLILVDYHPPTPLTGENVAWHLIFGVDGMSVRTTICAGRLLMRQGELLTIDEPAVISRARDLARKLWARY